MKPSILLASLALLAGCATPPPRQAAPLPVADAPAAYVEAPVQGASPDGWLDQFGDGELQAYVKEVLADNLDLGLAARRLETARLTAVIATGQRLPDLSASLSGEREGTLENGSAGDTYRAGLSLGWEVDLWGRLRNSSAAALADYQAVQADYQGAQLSLAATATRAWFDAVTSRQQLDLAERSLRTYEDSARLIRSRYEAGTSSALDLRLTLANVASAAARVQQRRQQLAGAVRILELLAADYPGGQLAVKAQLPGLLPAIPSGLPSDLLTRRPDIVAAERAYAASQQRAARAAKDLFPSIRLTASLGGVSDELDDVFEGPGLWSLLGSITQPLLNGGELRARRDIAETEAESSGIRYVQVILTAFRDVEQALASETYLREREAHLLEAVQQSIAAEELSWDQYTSGIGDIITVLEAQRRSIAAQTELLDVRNARLQNRVALHVALGGSYDSPPPEPPASPSGSALQYIGP